MIAITSTVPQEILWAAGETVIDLNNLFIQGDQAHFLDIAERNGFPNNICAWIKGLYGVIKQQNIKKVLGVIEGDCSTTKGLLEIIANEGVQVIPFAFPQDHSKDSLAREITKLQSFMQVSPEQVQTKFEQLNQIRKLLTQLDQVAIQGSIDSKSLYLWLLSSSDFNGNPIQFEQQLTQFLAKIGHSQHTTKKRLGYLGVPMIQPQILDIIEQLNARITFFEIPRQFCLIPPVENFLTAYHRYTYPYHVQNRIADIKQAINQRQLSGLIHYTQSFCFRQIEDILFKKDLDLPILTLEIDRPGQVDTRTRLRLESFIESLD